MPRVRALLLFSLAAAAVFAPPPRAAAQVHPEYGTILANGNAAAADAFLRDQAAQANLKASDPSLFGTTFARATELLDLAHLINGDPQPAVYRKGLMIRTGCIFCQMPSRLLAWTGQNFPSLSPDRNAALRKGLLEWNSLDPEPLAWLTAHGRSPSTWVDDLKRRSDALQPWIDAQIASLTSANPPDDAALEALRKRLQGLDDYMDNEQAGSLWTHFESAESAVKGLDSVRQRVAGSGDARLKGLLAQAEGAGTLEARLSLLSQLFDGLGLPNAAVRAAAPPRAGQVFDAASRGVVADLLKTGLMREIAGTWPGDTLIEFYKTNALDLRVAPAPNENEIGSYHGANDAIYFNEAYIQRFLKARGKDIRDLQQDPALLRSLTIELSPLFVHESTHKRQRHWAADSGVDEVGVQNLEMEANETEALFVVEKSLRDPSFVALLKADANAPGLASQSLGKARALASGGGAYFRDMIDDVYMNQPSLEGDAWMTIKGNGGSAGSIPDSYAACRTRLEWMNWQLDSHLNAVLAQGAAGTLNDRAGVPPSP